MAKTKSKTISRTITVEISDEDGFGTIELERTFEFQTHEEAETFESEIQFDALVDVENSLQSAYDESVRQKR